MFLKKIINLVYNDLCPLTFHLNASLILLHTKTVFRHTYIKEQSSMIYIYHTNI